jgi:hypothetical protein
LRKKKFVTAFSLYSQRVWKPGAFKLWGSTGFNLWRGKRGREMLARREEEENSYSPHRDAHPPGGGVGQDLLDVHARERQLDAVEYRVVHAVGVPAGDAGDGARRVEHRRVRREHVRVAPQAPLDVAAHKLTHLKKQDFETRKSLYRFKG